MSQSKRDLAAAEESFTKEMERKMEEQAREGERMMQQLRTAMIDEREAALEKERQHAQQRVQSVKHRTHKAKGILWCQFACLTGASVFLVVSPFREQMDRSDQLLLEQRVSPHNLVLYAFSHS